MRQIRAVVVEDHPIYRQGLVALLEADGIAVVGVADGVGEALQLLDSTRPDVVLVDLFLTDGLGVDIVRQVSEAGAVRSIVLTVSHDPEEMLAAIRSGADGFLTKDQAPERLARAIRGVLDGEAALSRRMTAHLLRDVRDGQRRVVLASHFPHRERLTPRQLEILQLIASGQTTTQIAERLFLSPETVRWHVKLILRKLNAKTRAEAAATLREIAV